MNAKKILKGIAIYLSSAFLVLVLFMLAYFTVFATVTANPDKVKGIISQSGIYPKVTPVVLENLTKPVQGEGQGVQPDELPLQNEMVKNAAIKVFDPQFVQTNLESAIDGTYTWLNGQAPKPAFNIDLAGAKSRFAQELADEAGARVEMLPLCTLQQQRELQETDLLSLPCKPRNVNIEVLKAEFISSVNNDENFLKETNVSAENLKDESGKSTLDNYKDLPKAFQLGKDLPYILGVIALILGAVIVFLSETKREGLKKLFKIFLITGVFVVLIPFAFNALVGGLNNGSDGASDNVVKELLVPVLDKFVESAAKVYYIVGAVYLLIAAGLFAGYKKLEPPAVSPKKESSGIKT